MKNVFRCNHCGNITEGLVESGVPMVCCGENMEKLVANSTDAATEKHVPVIAVEGNMVTVTVGEVAHPMEEKHYIQFVILETDKGVQKKFLSPGEAPAATFALCEGEKVVAAYEYCNLHGFWVKKA